MSTSGSDNNNGTSPNTPWKTLAKVELTGHNGTLHAGDTILFKKGDQFAGILKWDKYYGYGSPTGTQLAPITFASYGTGPKPLFQYPPLGPAYPATADSRRLMSFLGVDYIVIDGLNFTDLVFDRADKLTPANMGIAIQLGTFDEAINRHNIVRNVDMSNIGMGIVIHGEFNTVDHCTMTDLKNLVDTQCPDGGTTGYCSYEDYGANGITVSGNDNVFTHNLFTGNWAHSYDFTYNGGAIEAYGGTLGLNRNKIMYNTMVDNGGVMEIGSSGAAVCADNVIAYNQMVNNGMLTWVNVTGVFATATSNVQYFNNTIVETASSRWHNFEDALFGSSAPGPANTLFNLKNNIFYLSGGLDVIRANATVSKYIHENNVMHLGTGSVANYTLNASEVSTTAAVFTDTTNVDASQWDFRLLANSPARGAGTTVGILEDIRGHAVPTQSPDVGAYQY